MTLVAHGYPCLTDGYGKDEVIQKDRLSAIQESLLGFIHEEVVMPIGKHYYDASKKSNRD
jgi:hypothetical protein